jgi:hypothetical protein
VKVLMEFNLPVVVADLDGDRNVDRSYIPTALLDANYYTLSTSFQPAIIKYALDYYAPAFADSNTQRSRHTTSFAPPQPATRTRP